MKMHITISRDEAEKIIAEAMMRRLENAIEEGEIVSVTLPSRYGLSEAIEIAVETAPVPDAEPQAETETPRVQPPAPAATESEVKK